MLVRVSVIFGVLEWGCRASIKVPEMAKRHETIELLFGQMEQFPTTIHAGQSSHIYSTSSRCGGFSAPV